MSDARRWLKTRGTELLENERHFIQRSVRKNRLRLFWGFCIAMLPLSFAAGITFWLTENELSPRAGWYVQLAQAGIYTLQPEMVQIPPKDVWQDESRRSFTMGSNEDSDEEPPHQVTFSQPFRIGEYEVTFDEYQVFAYLIEGDGGCEDLHKIKKPNDDGWGRGRRSVINVSWLDAIC